MYIAPIRETVPIAMFITMMACFGFWLGLESRAHAKQHCPNRGQHRNTKPRCRIHAKYLHLEDSACARLFRASISGSYMAFSTVSSALRRNPVHSGVDNGPINPMRKIL